MAVVVSSLLSTIAEKADIPTIQVLFITLQISGLVLAILYRTLLHPHRVSTTVRHVTATVIGLFIGVHCYSWSMCHLLLQPTLAYILMKTVNHKSMPKVVFLVSMAYLSVEHLQQLMRNFTADLDHIGPMMLITQRITSLAFGIHDGLYVDDSKLNPRQRKLAVRRFPTLIEYYSYIFHFQALAVGPFCFYKHYIEFIEGQYLVYSKKIGKDGKEEIVYKDPPVMVTAVRKLFSTAIVALFCYFSLANFPVTGNISEEVKSSSVLYRMLYMVVSAMGVQSKYIFAWGVADVVCNLSGLGFNGYHDDGSPRWDLVTNVHLIPFLMATNLREVIANWHIPAANWLKYVCFDRVPRYKDVLTFALSCVWHGFYPGYIWTVTNAIFVTIASKKVRQNIRPYFIGNGYLKLFYDFITWFANTLALEYIFLPFMLLENDLIIDFYKSIYFCGHLIVFSIILVLSFVKTSKKEQRNNSVTSSTVTSSPVNGQNTKADTNKNTDGTSYKIKSH